VVQSRRQHRRIFVADCSVHRLRTPQCNSLSVQRRVGQCSSEFESIIYNKHKTSHTLTHPLTYTPTNTRSIWRTIIMRRVSPYTGTKKNMRFLLGDNRLKWILKKVVR
jgi:hypothetical protein